VKANLTKIVKSKVQHIGSEGKNVQRESKFTSLQVWQWKPLHSDLQLEFGVHLIDWHRGLKGGAAEQTTGLGS